MIPVTGRIAVDERDLTISFIRASGPGGQNVNKVETAVQLRYDVAAADLPEGVKARLVVLAGSRMTGEGVLILTAQRFRTQERNRQDAIERLCELVRAATEVPKPRRPTRPTRASQRRRVDSKTHRGKIKRDRGRLSGDD